MGAPRSPAAELLAGLVKRVGSSAVARRLSLTEGAVRSHAEGRAVPRRKVQERYRDIYEIPIEAWPAPQLERAGAPARAPRADGAEGGEARGSVPAPRALPPLPEPVPLPDVPKESIDAQQMVLRLLEAARQEIEKARGDQNVPYNVRASLITSATRLCQLLARLSGDLEVTHAAILRSAAWARIVRTFEAVFDRHPEAQPALAEFAREVAALGE